MADNSGAGQFTRHAIPDYGSGIPFPLNKVENIMRYSSLSLLVASALAGAAHADFSNEIKFTGEVVDQTCEVVVDGQTKAQVELPNVGVNQMAEKDSTAGDTPFVLNVSKCKVEGKKLSLRISTENVTDSGNFKNTRTEAGSAVGYAVQLVDDKGTPIKADAGKPHLHSLGKTAIGSIDYNFTARYIREEADENNLEFGPITTVVKYELAYQ